MTGQLVRNGDEFVARWIALGGDAERYATLGSAASERASACSWNAPSISSWLRPTRPSRCTPSAWPSEELGPEEVHHPLAVGPQHGVRRSVHLFKLFRQEQVDPDRFYHYLAADTLRQVRQYVHPVGAPRSISAGDRATRARRSVRPAPTAWWSTTAWPNSDCTSASRARHCKAMVNRCRSRRLRARIVHSSNVLEHVPDWEAMLTKMARVPNRQWCRLFELHELVLTVGWSRDVAVPSPRRQARGRARHAQIWRASEERVRCEPVRLDIAQVMRWFRNRSDVEVLWVGPRYLPEWMRWVAHTPAIREVVTWNLVIVFRRRAGASPHAA